MPHLGRVSSHFFRLLRLSLLVSFTSWGWSFYQSIQPHLDRISLEFLDIFGEIMRRSKAPSLEGPMHYFPAKERQQPRFPGATIDAFDCRLRNDFLNTVVYLKQQRRAENDIRYHHIEQTRGTEHPNHAEKSQTNETRLHTNPLLPLILKLSRTDLQAYSPELPK